MVQWNSQRFAKISWETGWSIIRGLVPESIPQLLLPAQEQVGKGLHEYPSNRIKKLLLLVVVHLGQNLLEKKLQRVQVTKQFIYSPFAVPEGEIKTFA